MNMESCNHPELGDESISEIRRDIRRHVDELRRKAERVSITRSQLACTVSSAEWTSLDTVNVKIRLCSLNSKTDRTVANIQIDSGGEIAPHARDRVERIYVIAGSYIDTVSGMRYVEGDVQVIQAGVSHALKSDFCLLTMTWQPAYPVIEYIDDTID